MWLGEIVNPMGAVVASNLILQDSTTLPTMALVELRHGFAGHGF